MSRWRWRLGLLLFCVFGIAYVGSADTFRLSTQAQIALQKFLPIVLTPCTGNTFPTSTAGVWSCTKPALTATTASLGGGALIAGACTSGTVTVATATTAMVASASPTTYPGDGVVWTAQVTSAGTVTVKVCAMIGLTPGASTYLVRVLP